MNLSKWFKRNKEIKIISVDIAKEDDNYDYKTPEFKCVAPSEVPCFNRYGDRKCCLDIDYNCSMRADVDEYGQICLSEEQFNNLMSDV